MKNTVKRISILASALFMAVANCFTTINASAEKSVDVSSGYAYETISLSDAKAIAGNQVMVEVSLNTGNECEGYNLDIEFDSNLTLKKVEGAITWEVNDNVASIIGFTGNYYADNTPVATLIFETPENVSEPSSYSIEVCGSELTCQNDVVITNADAKSSTVDVVKDNSYISLDNNGFGLRGDANEDGKVDLQDAIKIAKFLIGKEKLSVNGICQADINENNKVELQDVIGVSKYMISSDKANAWETILNK